MSKLLILILVGLALYLLIKGFGRRASTRKPKADAPAAGERMVSCAHCGVHMPQSDAISGDGIYFCGEAHRRLGAR